MFYADIPGVSNEFFSCVVKFSIISQNNCKYFANQIA